MVHIASAISPILWYIRKVQEWAISVTCMTFPKLLPWLTIVPAVKYDYAYCKENAFTGIYHVEKSACVHSSY